MTEDSRPYWPFEPDPERDHVVNARSLRAVAHPVRLRILGLLRMEGPATATSLAARLGLNSGATSYHLRQLAAAGLIVEDTERGTGRDRWWRAAHRAQFFQTANLPEEQQEVGVEYLRAISLVYADQMQRAAEERPMLPQEWRDAGAFADYMFHLTADEAKHLMRDIREVVSRYRSLEEYTGSRPEDVPPAAEPFHLQLQAFVRPGRERSDDHDDAAFAGGESVKGEPVDGGPAARESAGGEPADDS